MKKKLNKFAIWLYKKTQDPGIKTPELFRSEERRVGKECRL